MSIPTTCPSGATASASAMVRSPPPHPMSHTRWPGRGRAASRRYGDRASVSRSLAGPRRHPPVVVPPLRFLLVGHSDNVSVPGRFGGVRIGLVILPSDRWSEARRQWEWADGAGFHTAWTYDHIRWGGMPDGPWHAAVPVLAAAAAVTERVRLGTLVATPNFRHPVTLARDALALDDLSGGRLDLGLGPGSEGPDADRARAGTVDAGRAPGALRGVPPGAPAHRGRRADDADVDDDGPLHRATRRPARRARCSARFPSPSPPAGPRACGSPPSTGATGSRSAPPGADRAPPRPCSQRCAASSRSSRTRAARSAGTRRASARCCCGRRPSRSSSRSTSSTSWSTPYAELGFDQFVLHHPAQTGPYGGDVATFEQIAARRAAAAA